MIIHRNRCNETPFFEDQATGSVPMPNPGVEARDGPFQPALAVISDDPKGHKTEPSLHR